jgi:site-specific DNA recombinase
MIAAIYARKSTEQIGIADEQKSVARQIEHARAFAVSKGWTVDPAHIYEDDGISGAEFERRPAFLRLMNALKPRPAFDVIIMSEESRLGREAIETAYALKQIIQAGVRVWFYMENRERTLETPTDKLLMSVTAFADELEREKARQRTYDTMHRKAKAGHVTGGRVFGYDNVDVSGPDGQRSHVERRINDAEAAVVRRIFDLTAQGYGRKRVVQILNEEGAVSPRAQRGRPHAWCPSSVHEALHRELYRGVIVWNRSRKRDRWGRHRQHARDAAEWMRVDAPDLRIVPEDVWTAVHERLSQRRAVYFDRTGGKANGRPVAGTVSPYLLTGFVACGCCEGALVVRTRPHGRRRDPRLGCWYYHTRGRRVCSNRWEASMTGLENTVLTAIEEDVLAPDIVEESIARALEIVAAGAIEPDTSAVIRRQIAALDRELERLTALAAAGGADIPTVLEALRTRQERRRVLSGQAERSPRPRQRARSGDEIEAQLRGRFADFRALLRRNVPFSRPVLEALLTGRIVVTPRPESTPRAASFDVRIPLTTRGIFEGICCPKGDTSPAGFEPALPA